MTPVAALLAGLSLSLSLVTPVLAQAPAPAQPAASSDEPVPREARAKARRDCLADHVALSGNDLRAAMRDCIQAKFPDVQLYARDGVMRDGRPTAAAARTACKDETDAKALSGAERRQALVVCFNAKRPDLALRGECRREARGKGLDGAELRKAIESCAREARS